MVTWHNIGELFKKEKKKDEAEHSESRFWMDDKKCKNCYECDVAFTLFNRRHHCRKCGKVFCSKCAGNSIPGNGKSGESHVRVCNYCYMLHNERPVSYDLQRSSRLPIHSVSRRLTASHHTFNQSEDAEGGETDDTVTGSSKSAQQHRYESGNVDIARPSRGLSEGEVAVAGSFTTTATREHASSSVSVTKSGENQVEAESSFELSDQDSSKKGENVESSSQDMQEFLDGSPYPSMKSDGYPSGLGSDCSIADLALSSWNIPGTAVIPALVHKSKTANLGKKQVLQSKLYHYLQCLENEFHIIANEHLRYILHILLENHDIESKNQWIQILQDIITTAANNIDPLQIPPETLDPRKYIKVKRVNKGSPEDSQVIKGLVCTKNIAHRRMPNKIEEPRILLLGCAIEYQRMENRLSSLDILLEQEREHLRLSVARILQYGPTLIFVEKTVARNAQELLLQAGVTLVLKMKPSLMNHISRLTGAEIIVNLVDISPEKLGTCGSFRIETFKASEESMASSASKGNMKNKTLLFLDQCPNKVGCSIILKGSSLATLLLLKRIVNFGIYVAYHNRIEAKFLSQQCLSTWPLGEDVPIERTIKNLRIAYKEVREANTGGEISISPYIIVDHSCIADKGRRMSRIASSSQDVFVSLTSRCPSRGLLCEVPTVHEISFYEASDVSLIRFLLAALPEPQRHCPHHRCGDGPEKHIRSYISGESRVTLTVRELPEDKALSGGDSNLIWIWRHSLHDPFEQPLRIPMTNEAAQISLGCFLQYFFSAPLLKAINEESLNNDFTCYFGIGNKLAKFTCEKVKTLGVCLPPIPIPYNHDFDRKWLMVEKSNVVYFHDDLFQKLEGMVKKLRKKLKSSTSDSHEADLVKLESEIQHEKKKQEAIIAPNDIAFDEKSRLYVFEMNKLRKHIANFALSCMSKGMEMSEKLGVQVAHGKKPSLLNWFESGTILEDEGMREIKKRSDEGNSSAQNSMHNISRGMIDNHTYDSIVRAQINGQNSYHSATNSASSLLDGGEKDYVWDKISSNRKSATDPVAGESLAQLKLSTIVSTGRYTLPQGVDEKVVAVYDDEPTSLIAFVLNSKKYRKKILEVKEVTLHHSRQKSDSGVHSVGQPSEASSTAEASKSTTMSGEGGDLNLMLSEETTHIKHVFEDYAKDGVSKVHFQVTAYYAAQFEEIRRLFASGENTYIHSLLRCRKWETKGGKSNAYFAKTLDDRFVVKQMSKTEISSFLSFAPSYFRYMNTKLDEGREPSCLAKIFGVYQLVIKNSSIALNAGSTSKDVRIDLMVMENIFYAKTISRVYDLKGSIRSRYNAEPSATNAVLLDENLLETLPAAPILVKQEARAKLERALWCDTSFLAQLGVMDYSLLVGIDDVNSELVVGIIDYIRQYTWDKQLETWVKSSGILGGAGKVPTIISPKQYMKRFRIAMMLYFTLVPSHQKPKPSLDPEAI